MTIKLNYKEDKKYEAINESGNILPIDMLAVTDKEAFSPTQLLLAGVASCAAVDLVSMIKKKGICRPQSGNIWCSKRNRSKKLY
jgi:putative redox protein